MNILYKELKQIISNRLFICMWFILLIVLSIIMSIDVPESKEKKDEGAVIGLVNDDSSSYSELFINFITESDEFSKIVTVKKGTKEEIEKLFYEGELDAYICIQDGFINNIMDVKETPLNVMVSDRDTVIAILVSNIMSAYQEYVSSIQLNVTALYDCLRKLGFSYSKTEVSCFSVTYVLVENVFEKTEYMDIIEISEKKSSGIVTYLTYSAMVIVIMYVSLFAGIYILKEKSYWVLNRYLISKSSVLKLVVIKDIFYTSIIFILMFVPTLISSLIKHYDMNWSLMVLFFVFTFTSVCFSSMLSYLLGNLNVFALVSNMLYIIWIIIGGGIIPISYMPDKLAKIGEYTPVKLFITSFVRAHDNKTLEGLYNNIFICIICSIIFIVISCYFFKKNTYRQE